MDSYRAVVTSQAGGAEVLEIREFKIEKPKPNEVLIKVRAAGINKPDSLQRMGLYPPPPGASNILGLEVAGEIAETGDGVKGLKVGDKVCALVISGGYGEYVIAHEKSVLPIPKNFSFIEAAGLPETFFTVWSNVFDRGALKKGEVFLIHGGASGIGTTAIQMAYKMGAYVIATAGSEEKCKLCEKLGAKLVINYKKADFEKVIKEAQDINGVDVILDMVGGDYIQKNINIAKTEGRIVQIAFLKGAKAQVNFMRLMLKRIHLSGSTLRSRADMDKEAIAIKLKKYIWPLLDEGEIKPYIYKVFEFDDVIKAHELLDSGKHMGKIILNIS